MSQQIDKKLTFQVRLDTFWWKVLSEQRTLTRSSFKSLVEASLAETYGINSSGKSYKLTKA